MKNIDSIKKKLDNLKGTIILNVDKLKMTKEEFDEQIKKNNIGLLRINQGSSDVYQRHTNIWLHLPIDRIDVEKPKTEEKDETKIEQMSFNAETLEVEISIKITKKAVLKSMEHEDMEAKPSRRIST